MVFSTAGFPPVSREKLVENGGTEGAPRGHGPPLKPHMSHTAGYGRVQLSSTKFSSTSTFFFFPITLRDQGFVNNISEKHTRVKFHCRLLHGKIEIALVNHGWRLPCIKVLESRGKIPRTTAAWA